MKRKLVGNKLPASKTEQLRFSDYQQVDMHNAKLGRPLKLLFKIYDQADNSFYRPYGQIVQASDGQPFMQLAQMGTQPDGKPSPGSIRYLFRSLDSLAGIRTLLRPPEETPIIRSDMTMVSFDYSDDVGATVKTIAMVPTGFGVGRLESSKQHDTGQQLWCLEGEQQLAVGAEGTDERVFTAAYPLSWIQNGPVAQ